MAETTYASLLDNFIKKRYTDIITPAEVLDVPLLEALKSNVGELDTNGNAKILIETLRAMNARGVPDSGLLQSAKPEQFVEMTIPIYRILATCGVTEKVMKTATGGANSWGAIVGRKLDNMIADFKYVQQIACATNGTGCLARAASATYTGGGETFDSSTGANIICDNTYADSNIENVQLIKVGMYISIWDVSATAFMTDTNGNTEWLVTAVNFKKRKADNYAAPTDASITIAGITGGGLSAAIADNDFIFLPGARSTATEQTLPMGLGGIIANNNTGEYDDDLVAPYNLTTFQGLTRANYPTLCSDVWKASDFGLTTESPTDGTPTMWDLSVISNAMENVYQRGGKTTLIRCHPELGHTMHGLNRTGSSIQVVVNNTGQQNQNVIGTVRPERFIDVKGDLVTLVLDPTCPRYVIEGIDTSVLHWFPLGNADYRRDYGPVWQPTRGTRATTLECGYEWWYEIGAERCDFHWRIQDLRTDI